MIDREHDLPITKQAQVLRISRGSAYYLPRPVSASDLEVMRRLDRLHLEFPFAGSRMLRGLLAAEGCKIGRRHVKTLMQRMGIEALYRRPRTTKPEPGHKIYPYLLRGAAITRPNQVWGDGHQCAAGSGVRDGGWSPAIGLQERVANHRKRRWSKAGVVSVTEKALQRRQVGDRKANTREPPFKCRKCSDDVETGE